VQKFSAGLEMKTMEQDTARNDHLVSTIDALEALYPEKPYPPAVVKEIDRVNAHYRKFIEAAPFLALATSGPDGLDCSPRGDAPGFVRVQDEKTLLIPDRRGNNRIDSMRNILTSPRVALLFLIPGVGETIRVIGRASISTDPALTETFVVNGKAPRCVIIVAVERVFFQCSKAIIRSRLWDPSLHADRKSLPTTGTILADISGGKVGGAEYDRGQPERIKATIY
jgi:uncharacterized protein